MASNSTPPGDITKEKDLHWKWNEYVNHGRWTLDAPNDQGYYARGSRDGQFVDIVQVVTHYGEPFYQKGQNMLSTSLWAGYWWSLPLPMLPDPPEHA